MRFFSTLVLLLFVTPALAKGKGKGGKGKGGGKRSCPEFEKSDLDLLSKAAGESANPGQLIGATPSLQKFSYKNVKLGELS